MVKLKITNDFSTKGRKNESFDTTNMTKEVKQMIRNIVGINATLKPLPEHILYRLKWNLLKYAKIIKQDICSM